jgi:hypothetical protein
MEFLALLWWELLQNIPLIFGFVGGLLLWEQRLMAAVCMVGSSVVAALVIAATEGRIFRGHRESGRAIAANVLVFSAGMLAGAAYFKAGWSAWYTDLGIGTGAGILVASVQDRAAQERFGVLRAAMLGLCCAVTLVLIRLVGGFLAAVVALAWFTLVMGAYKEWWQKPRSL